MPRYEWTGADTFADNRNDRDVEPGDVVDLDAHVGDPQPEFVRVEDEDDSEDDTDAAAEESADESSANETGPPLDPDDYSVAELRDALSEGDYTAAELDAVEAAERADGSPRQTALDAIDAARE